MLTRYTDVDEALRNPRVTIHPEPGKFPQGRIGQGPASRLYRESLPSLDPPDHTRIRRILTPAFTSRAMGKRRGWMEAVIERHLAKFGGESEVDFVAAVASPIAAEVACKLAHVPVTDAHELISRVHELIAVLGASSMTSGALEAADAAGHFCYAYMEDLLDTLKRTKLPADNPVGVLLAAEGHRVTMVSPSGDIPAVRARFRNEKFSFNLEHIEAILAR